MRGPGLSKKIGLAVVLMFVIAGAATAATLLALPRSVADVVTKYGPAARQRIVPYFRRAGLAYPPKQIALLVFKDEERVSLWARSDTTQPWKFIRRYPILAASG